MEWHRNLFLLTSGVMKAECHLTSDPSGCPLVQVTIIWGDQRTSWPSWSLSALAVTFRDRRRREILLWRSHPWSQGLLLFAVWSLAGQHTRSHLAFMLRSSDSWWAPCPSQVWPPSGQKGSHRCRLTHHLPQGVWVLTCCRSPPSSQQQTGILLEPLFLSKPCLWHPTSLQTACWWILTPFVCTLAFIFYLQFLKVAFHL